MKQHIIFLMVVFCSMKLQAPDKKHSKMERETCIALNKLIERFRRNGMSENTACCSAKRIMQSLQDQISKK